MAELSLTAAAKAVGIARSTFNEHVAAGKVSVKLSGQGRRTVDTSELLRVYGALRGAPDSSAGHNRTASDSLAGQELAVRAAVLEAENRGLQAVLTEKDLRIDELHRIVRLLELKPPPESRVSSVKEAVQRPKTKSMPKLDRQQVATVATVLVLVVFALVLQAIGVIRLH